MVKKAQMKIQQMAFMLMAITVFFVLVGMFVLMFRLSGLRSSAEELDQRNALLLVTKLANSPEFSCGDSFGTDKIDCIDADKVMTLKKSITKYLGFWGSGIKNIEIRRILDGENKNCEIGNYPNCNSIGLISNEITGIPVENFVTLCIKEEVANGVYDNCEIAKLIIYYDE